MIAGLHIIDLLVIVGYFVVITAIGLWASQKVHNDEDFFVGGRTFGKGLLVMHWLCTGTHSEQAVQVAGAVSRVGLGGIWYQWMWMFSTPFYWLLAPIIRRLRVITTGDFYRIRYGRSLEMLYATVGLLFNVLAIAMLLRGAGAAIAGATGGAIQTEWSVVLLALMFSGYVMAGGLMAAAYTDFVQGFLIILLSVMLVPAGLSYIGGFQGLHDKLPAAMLSITAPHGAKEGDPWWVLAMSVMGLVNIAVQPHVMSANGSGKTETESRVGMCYGNFIKRLLTIAWAFTGLIAAVYFADQLKGLAGHDLEAKSETLFGAAIKEFLGTGWRGLMIACLIAGVTSAEVFMIVGSGLFTRNFYTRIRPNESPVHYLWVGRLSAAALLVGGILLALGAGSVTQLLTLAMKFIALMGAGFWVGVVWRKANTVAVWISFLVGLGLWFAMEFEPTMLSTLPGGTALGERWVNILNTLHMRGHSDAMKIMLMLGSQFGSLILISLITPSQPTEQLDAFYARLLTPVGREEGIARPEPAGAAEHLGLGLHGTILDYNQASHFGIPALQRIGVEIPRLTTFDVVGFLAAWVLVGAMIALLAVLATLK